MERVGYCRTEMMASIEESLYNRFNKLGLIPNNVRKENVGKSNYSEHVIQPWSIWLDYDLNAWDADIIKRVLRTKEEPGISKKEARAMDYRKIIHICNERLRQLEFEPDITTISSEPHYVVSPEVKDIIDSYMDRTFTLNENELVAYNTFKECHKDCDDQVQVSFSRGNGVGTIVRMYCPDCLVEEDITDYSKF